MFTESDEPTVESLASALMRTMLHELVTDIAIEEHRLAWRRRTRIQATEAQAKAKAAERLLGVNGDRSNPSSAGATASTSTLARSASPFGHPSPHKKDDALYECMVCGRQIGAPRFASHLSSCMGLTGRSKRTAANKPPINGKLHHLGSDRASSYASDEDSLSGTEKREWIIQIPLIFLTSRSHESSDALSLSHRQWHQRGLERAQTLGEPVRVQRVEQTQKSQNLKRVITSSSSIGPHQLIALMSFATAIPHPANTLHAQIASIGSHPLAKTLSAPAIPPIPKTSSEIAASPLSGPCYTTPTPPLSNMHPSLSLTSSKSLAPKKPPIPSSKKPIKSTDRPDSDSEEDSPDEDATGEKPTSTIGSSLVSPKNASLPRKMPGDLPKKGLHPLAHRGSGYGSDSDSGAGDVSESD
ncbi:BQ2448_3924 [Microbotryum intermedium]|uniref:SAGA-associated factor 11 n=1 Tax=Microbotryum intermedium TaxID=269621 RepID=A0A238FGM7_9BASI|nr:BQ2448_3924 [Microbotryum intermedium]